MGIIIKGDNNGIIMSNVKGSIKIERRSTKGGKEGVTNTIIIEGKKINVMDYEVDEGDE